MLELNSTKKALFTFGIGAFGKMSELIKDTNYLPQQPAYLFKLLRMAYSVNIKNNDMAQELTKDKEAAAHVLNIPSLKDNENIEQEDLANAISNLERSFIQSSLEVDFAKKYHSALVDRLTNENQKAKLNLSLKAAIIAKSIAKWVDYKDKEVAFFAALLADVPAQVLSINDPESQEKIDEKVSMGMSEKEAEIVVLGFDHTEFGSKLFKYYSMPSPVVDLIQNDFKTDRVKPKNEQLAKIVNFSKFLAKCFSDKTQTPSSIWLESQKSIESLGLNLSVEQWGNKISLMFVKAIEFEMSVTG